MSEVVVNLLPAKIISKRLIPWQQQYGRHDLPWQQSPSPYRVWVSEIMLQQTQVETVKAYYLRFMEAFPTLTELANASIDTVLQLWSGLGYYARARHLHQTAQIIATKYQGQFPADVLLLTQLPGIGTSTAGAILSLAMKQGAVILDGNVKRVLTRVYAMSVWPSAPNIQKQLWDIARHHTPKQQAHIYNQALMDLGAMICTRKNPLCGLCPLQKNCLAYQAQQQNEIPLSKPKRALPEKQGFMLVLLHPKTDAVLLEKRPAKGIWGGLWCFPECPKPGRALNAWLPDDVQILTKEGVLDHIFTHYRWFITPIRAKANNLHFPDTACHYEWHKLADLRELALAAPVKRLLTQDLLK